MEQHQLTNETKQTGFRAGFFPGLIGINCERLQSTTRRLTFASSERFLLIVLMITMGAGDHYRRGMGCLVPGLVSPRSQERGMFPGSHFPLLPATRGLCKVPSLGHWNPRSGPGCRHTQLGKAHGAPTGCRPRGGRGRGGKSKQDLAGLALRLEYLGFLICKMGVGSAPQMLAAIFLLCNLG